ERQLREAGWPRAEVAGGSLALPDVVFDRVALTAGGTLIGEDVRARLGPEIEHLTIGRLRLAASVAADGRWTLPGAPASDGGPLPIDLMPRHGISLERADVRLDTPAGTLSLRLSG